MRMTQLRRACAAAVTLPLVLAALVIAAAPATAGCGGPAGVDGEPVEFSVDPNSRSVCVGNADGPPTIVGISGGSVHQVTATFDCANATSGAIGDPGDPTTYVPYRIGSQPGMVCAEAAGVKVTALVQPGGSPPHVWFAQGSPYGHDPSCDGSGGTPIEVVYLDTPAGYQEVWVGLGSPFGGSDTSDCGGTQGAYDCTYTGSPLGLLSFDPDRCPDGYAATQTVYGLPAYALAFAGETGGTVVAIAGDAVTTVLAEVEPVLIEVGRILAPLVDEAWRVAGTVVGVVNDNVALGTTQGDCTVNVASAGDVAIMRSPTGQVPTSICLVVGSAVTRVTIG